MPPRLKQPYESHEIAYRRMRDLGIRNWGQRSGNKPQYSKPIQDDTERWMIDALAQPFAPTSGRALEVGCGTGPMLRWLHSRGFEGVGVDVSETAIAMAREESISLTGIRFEVADVCKMTVKRFGKFDLVLDGNCLHCVVGQEERRQFLRTVRRLLRPGGLFIVDTMCFPIDQVRFKEGLPQARIIGHVLYQPFKDAESYAHSKCIDGKWFIGMRYFASWRNILDEVRAAGFSVMAFRVGKPYGDQSNGGINIAALAV